MRRSRAGMVVLAAVVAALLWLVSGCAGAGGGGGGGAGGEGAGGGGGGGEKAPSGAKESVVKTIQVKETEFALKPAEITLDKPGTYVFKAVNSGNTVHALEIEGQDIEEETEEIQPGQSAELKVKLAAGTYELYCPVGGHKEEGMEGEVIVKEGSGGSGGY
jgi:uncharacterized cupredoxin-like copper-binding protein